MWERRLACVLPLMLVAAACGDGGTQAEVIDRPSGVVQVMQCAAQVGSGRLGCAIVAPSSQDADFLVIGGPNGDSIYLSNDSVRFQRDTFEAQVRITNIISSTLGTTDGYTPHPDGIRVFFTRGPHVAEPADSSLPSSVTLANPDGFHMFLPDSASPYFQYPGLLHTDQQSVGRWWAFRLENVSRFEFAVMVWAHVHASDPEHEQGGGG